MTLRTLVVGCGHMGASHARAYHAMPEFEIAGLVSRGPSRRRLNAELGGGTMSQRLCRRARRDAARRRLHQHLHRHTRGLRIAALEAGAHVFLEKPVAETIDACERVIATARRTKRALVVGYILQVHPSWQRFTEIARTLGTPLVMRMNLNQQSSGADWDTHKQSAAEYVADRRLRRALRGRHVPHDRRAPDPRQRHRRAARGRHRARARSTTAICK